MNKFRINTLASIGLIFVLMIGGCTSNKNTSTDDKNTGEVKKEVKQEVVELVKNDKYIEPLEPTAEEILAYNALSDAVAKANLKEEATQVGINFAYDFFTLSNKKDAKDIGGLQFISSDKIGDFMNFAGSYYYSNFPTIVNKYGKDSLPKVVSHKVESVTESQFTYNNGISNGYLVKLTLTYADSKIGVENLKTSMSIEVGELTDFDYDRSKDYSETVVHEGSMRDVYRVLAVE